MSKDVQKALILDVRTMASREAEARAAKIETLFVETEPFPQHSSSHGLAATILTYKGRFPN